MLDEAGAAQKLLPDDQRVERIGPDQIEQIVAKMARVPVQAVSSDDPRALASLDAELTRVIFGQESAIDEVASAIKLSRSGLRAADKPIGNFLFAGPTGVGKTELAKALAEFLFDSEAAMVRIDMSEIGERHNVARLIGAPPGYVGYEEGGRLTEAVRRRPYAVVLLDEIEKAHRDVFNVLLQVLDDGRLTDGQGRTVDFRNTVIIMTSNVGSHLILERAGTVDWEAVEAQVLDALRQHFRPEFLNRVDDIVVFRPLGQPQLDRIIDLQLERLRKMLADRKIELEITPEAKRKVAEEGYDPAFGARPLKRAIQRTLQNPLAIGLLEGKFKDGDRIVADVDASGKLTFRTADTPAAEPVEAAAR